MGWTQVDKPVTLEPLTGTVWRDQRKPELLGEAMLGLLE